MWTRSKIILSSVKIDIQCVIQSGRYPVERGPFSQITPEDIKFFTELLSPHRIITEESELEGHNTDWLGMVRGASSVLLKPKTTEEVSAILSYCNQHKLAVCPQGIDIFSFFLSSPSLSSDLLFFIPLYFLPFYLFLL